MDSSCAVAHCSTNLRKRLLLDTFTATRLHSRPGQRDAANRFVRRATCTSARGHGTICSTSNPTATAKHATALRASRILHWHWHNIHVSR